MSKLRRASDEVIDVGEETTGKRSSGVEVVLKNNSVKNDVKKIQNLVIFFISMVIFIAIALYLCMSATLMNFHPEDNGKVAWNLYGVVPDKADSDTRYVTASATQQAPTDLLGRTLQSVTGIPDSFVGEVVSDRFDTVSSKDGVIYVNGKKTKYKGEVDKTKLNQEYLIKCVQGECKKDEYFIVKKGNIVGNLYGYLSFSDGFEPIGGKK